MVGNYYILAGLNQQLSLKVNFVFDFNGLDFAVLDGDFTVSMVFIYFFKTLHLIHDVVHFWVEDV